MKTDKRVDNESPEQLGTGKKGNESSVMQLASIENEEPGIGVVQKASRSDSKVVSQENPLKAEE